MAVKEKREVKEDIEKVLRMIGWQVAAGILFVTFGMELAFSNIILHALQPFEHGHNALVAIGLEAVGLEGLAATALVLVGSLNLGVAAWRFAKVLMMMDAKR